MAVGVDSLLRGSMMSAGQGVQNVSGNIAARGGAVSAMLEKITENTRKYSEQVQVLNKAQWDFNKAQKARADSTQKVIEANEKLSKTNAKLEKAQERLNRAQERELVLKNKLKSIEDKRSDQYKKAQKELEEAKEHTEALTDATKAITAEYKEQERAVESLVAENRKNNEELKEARQRYSEASKGMEEMNQQGSLLSSTLKMLKSKTLLAGLAVTAFHANMKMLDGQSRLVAATMLRFQENLTGRQGAASAAWEVTKATGVLNNTFARFHMEMAALGATSEEANEIYLRFARTLRSSGKSLTDNVNHINQLSKNAQMLAQVLGIDVNTVIDNQITLADKYGMSLAGAQNVMVDVHSTSLALNQAFGSGTIRTEDFAKAVLEASSHIQGFSINQRLLGTTIANTLAAAQKQGATYAQSLDVAKQMTDLISGAKTPEFAKWEVGGAIVNDLERMLDMAGNIPDAVQMAMEEYAKGIVDPKLRDQRRKQLENFFEEGRKLGEGSKRFLAASMFQQTEFGMKQTMDVYRKFFSGPEGPLAMMRHGLVDNIEDAFMMQNLMQAEQTDENIKKFQDLQKKIQTKKDALPSKMDELNKSFGGAVAALRGIENKGVNEYMKNTAKAALGLLQTNKFYLAAILTATLAQAAGGVANLIGGLGKGAAGAAGAGLGSAGAGAGAAAGGMGAFALGALGVAAAGAAGYGVGTLLDRQFGWSDDLSDWMAGTGEPSVARGVKGLAKTGTATGSDNPASVSRIRPNFQILLNYVKMGVMDPETAAREMRVKINHFTGAGRWADPENYAGLVQQLLGAKQYSKEDKIKALVAQGRSTEEIREGMAAQGVVVDKHEVEATRKDLQSEVSMLKSGLLKPSYASEAAREMYRKEVGRENIDAGLAKVGQAVPMLGMLGGLIPSSISDKALDAFVSDAAKNYDELALMQKKLHEKEIPSIAEKAWKGIQDMGQRVIATQAIAGMRQEDLQRAVKGGAFVGNAMIERQLHSRGVSEGDINLARKNQGLVPWDISGDGGPIEVSVKFNPEKPITDGSAG